MYLSWLGQKLVCIRCQASMKVLRSTQSQIGNLMMNGNFLNSSNPHVSCQVTEVSFLYFFFFLNTSRNQILLFLSMQFYKVLSTY